MPVFSTLLLNGTKHLLHSLADFAYRDMERAIRGWDPNGRFHWDFLRKNSEVDLDLSKKERQRLKIFTRLAH